MAHFFVLLARFAAPCPFFEVIVIRVLVIIAIAIYVLVVLVHRTLQLNDAAAEHATLHVQPARHAPKARADRNNHGGAKSEGHRSFLSDSADQGNQESTPNCGYIGHPPRLG